MSSEISFDWKPIKSKTFGDVARPIALIELKSNLGDWKIFYPEVDSGAIVSVFNSSDCKFLGYDLKKGLRFELSGVFGSNRMAYLHEIEMKIGKEITKTRIAFTEGENHKQLLGRIDVFNNFQICFRGKLLKTNMIKE